MTGQTHLNSGFNLVRWILIVSLGCGLGLVFIVVVLVTHTFPGEVQGMKMVRRTQLSAVPFRLSEEPMAKELTRVIEAQLSAFRKDDYPQAYTFAAAAIKAHVPLPTFERMVKSAYPIIAQSRSAHFGVILDNGDQAIVNVSIAGESGRTRHYQYILQRERTGWKISSVGEVQAEGTTV